MAKDHIFAHPLQSVGDFAFDRQVVEVFPDMIARSVPGYSSVLTLTVELAEQFAQPGTHVYDLGCSLGAATLPISERISEQCAIYAVDSSDAMVEQLRTQVRGRDKGCRIEIVHGDIMNVELERASFIFMNYTMQFIARDSRDALVQRIYESLLPGGAFILSEKICFESPAQQALMADLHHAFKRAHGYSELEISQKRTALENTLLPESIESHTARLSRAGFETVSTWFQCLNFASFIAMRTGQ